MEGVLAMLRRDDAEVRRWLEGLTAVRLRQMLTERRDDPVAEVLVLVDAIRARLNAVTAAT